ncbi:MAG: AMP-binding protein [Acidimicrobiales bacterium]
MAHSGGAVVVCDAELYPALAAVRSGLPRLRQVIVATADAPAGSLSWDSLVGQGSSAPPPPLPPDPAAPAKLMYPSGTTGTPKVALWSRNCEVIWARCYLTEMVLLNEGEAAYCCLPLFHVTCQGTVLAALGQGWCINVEAGFSPYGFWRRVREAEAVAFTFVGTILSMLARRPPQADDPDNPVRRVLGSGARRAAVSCGSGPWRPTSCSRATWERTGPWRRPSTARAGTTPAT